MQPFSRCARSLVACFTFVFLALTGVCFAQDGASTAGAARAKYLGNMGVLPSSREVVVEDFVNYHRHEIGRPKAGEAVALDLRWGNESVSANGDAILQVGFSTALATDRQQLRPLNLSIVIDKSGSMADDNKLVRVKQALLTLVSQLRPTDVLSIVQFDSDAQVLLPAERVTDKESIKSLIRELEPGSATNLNGGLMLGYQENLKHFRQDATNRVILLTDGIANRGVTDPHQIARNSASFNDRGIDLTTIGVGLDLNKDLLQTLAKSGHGLFHFIADSADIEKVFVKELQSQLSPVATDAKLEVDFGNGLKLDKVFGYQPHISDHSVKITLDNMNSGMTEVVLMRFKPRYDSAEESRLPVTVKLSYYDLDRTKTVEVTQQSAVAVGEGARKSSLEDSSVGKNYSIAVLAQAMKDMAADCEQSRYNEARATLDSAINRTSRLYPNLDDEDIKRTMSTALKYREVLHQSDREGDSREDDRDNAIDQATHENLIFNGDFSHGNVGFNSPSLSHFDAAQNSLWAMGYTIAPSFNSPQLHELVPSESYSAPKRPNGNEQVFFANVGGTESMVVWSTTVHCRPNTRYRLSFQAISLSDGRDWIPTFEIRVNGERSEPQAVGMREYAEVSTKWNSQGTRTASISIVRMAIPHGGGVIGIANIEMVPVR